MVYTANEKIAIAFSESPLGPFKNSIKTHYLSDFKEIDPFIFFDNGKFYLYRVRRVDKGNQIYVSELNENHSNNKRGWVWGSKDQRPVAALNTQGNMKLKGNIPGFNFTPKNDLQFYSFL